MASKIRPSATPGTASREQDLCQKAVDALQRSHIFALRDLEVNLVGDDLVVSGRVESYYYKQMAQEVIRAEVPATRLINQVKVD